MNTATRVFSVYVSDFAIELRDDGSEYAGDGRLLCSQRNYDSLLSGAENFFESYDGLSMRSK